MSLRWSDVIMTSPHDMYTTCTESIFRSKRPVASEIVGGQYDPKSPAGNYASNGFYVAQVINSTYVQVYDCIDGYNGQKCREFSLKSQYDKITKGSIFAVVEDFSVSVSVLWVEGSNVSTAHVMMTFLTRVRTTCTLAAPPSVTPPAQVSDWIPDKFSASIVLVEFITGSSKSFCDDVIITCEFQDSSFGRAIW